MIIKNQSDTIQNNTLNDSTPEMLQSFSRQEKMSFFLDQSKLYLDYGYSKQNLDIENFKVSKQGLAVRFGIAFVYIFALILLAFSRHYNWIDLYTYMSHSASSAEDAQFEDLMYFFFVLAGLNIGCMFYEDVRYIINLQNKALYFLAIIIWPFSVFYTTLAILNHNFDWIFAGSSSAAIIITGIIAKVLQYNLSARNQTAKLLKEIESEKEELNSWQESLYQLDKKKPELIDAWLEHKVEYFTFLHDHDYDDHEAELDALREQNPLIEYGPVAKAKRKRRKNK